VDVVYSQSSSDYRVARMLRDSRRQVIGVTSCGAEIDTVAAARQLAFALHLVSGRAVALLLPEGDADRHVALGHSDGVDEAHRPGTEQPLEALDEVLASLTRGYEHVLVPWRGIEARGDHLATAKRMDGVLVLALAGAVHETEVLSKQEELGKRLLGVLILGS
jgi:hypothetical protein